MSWENVLKLSYSSKNLSMFKEVIDKIYENIPVGTVLKSSDYWETFKEEVMLIIGTKGRKPIDFKSWTRGRGENWFNRYFTSYGKRQGYIMELKGKRVRWERV